MRCEGTRFGVKFSKAPLRGGRRYAPCTPAQDRAAVWRKNGFEPPFGAILDFVGPRKKAHVSTPSTLAVVQETPFVPWCLPLAPYTQARKTSDRKQLDSGGWGCRMTRLFSHKTGLADPLNPQNFRCAGRDGGALHPPRRPEVHPDRHYHPRHFRKRSRCPGAAHSALRHVQLPVRQGWGL